MQDFVTAVRAARLSAPVFSEETDNVGPDDRADAEVAKRGQDGADTLRDLDPPHQLRFAGAFEKPRPGLGPAGFRVR